ncbi:MAG TPA: hypothetical protein DCD99_11375 [Acinetobacter schindleri]|nr:hypothetical protein [Acinetobacter schindleri]
MADNEILTHKKISLEAAAMLEETLVFARSINRNREKDFAKKDGYTIGDEVTIVVPPVPVVTDGENFSEEDAKLNAKERSVKLKIDTHKHVGLRFSVTERMLQLDDFKKRFLQPAINSLATEIDADLVKRAILSVNNYVLQSNNEPHPTAAFGRARSLMNQALAPHADRFALLSSDFTNTIVDTSGTIFNPTAEISKQYKEGYIGRSRGFEFIESDYLYAQNYGTATGLTVSGANQKGGTLTVSITAGQTVKKGQVFTIAGVYSIHPITRQSTGKLMQFVVLNDVTATGSTENLSIYPEINPAMISSVRQANANVTASPAASAAITFGGSVNAIIDQALCYTENTFAAAFVPVPVVAGCEGYRVTDNQIGLTIQTGGNFNNLSEGTRIDVVYGFTTVRGNHACRIGTPRV